MSSNSSMSGSLHLVQHVRECGLQRQRLLDLLGADKWILAVFQETRALVLANVLDESRRIRLPVFGKAFEVFKNGTDTESCEQRHGILGVLIEVGVEDTLIHKVGFAIHGKQYPPKVMELEHGQTVRLARHGLFDVSCVVVKDRLSTRDDLGDDRESVTRWCLGKDHAVPALLGGEVTLLRDRHRSWSCP